MKRINAFTDSLLLENKFAFYLSFFRVFVCLLLLKRTIQLWELTPLIYAGKSYLVPSNTTARIFFMSLDLSMIRENIYVFLGIYAGSILLYLFGIGRNIIALIVFLLSDLVQSLCPQILNGGDNFLRFLLLYMVCADSFNYFSADSKLSGDSPLRNFLSNLSGLSVCIHLCLIYFISAVHKIHSDVWFSGVATYYTLSIERFNGTSLNQVLSKQPVFVTLSTYLTWIIELFYPILIWVRGIRPVLIFSAVALHLCIAVFMMLYDFQLIFIAVQGFFVTNAFWTKHYHRFRDFTLQHLRIA